MSDNPHLLFHDASSSPTPDNNLGGDQFTDSSYLDPDYEDGMRRTILRAMQSALGDDFDETDMDSLKKTISAASKLTGLIPTAVLAGDRDIAGAWSFDGVAVNLSGSVYSLDVNPYDYPKGYSIQAGKGFSGVTRGFADIITFRSGYGRASLQIANIWATISGSATSSLRFRSHKDSSDVEWSEWNTLYDTRNTTTDSNGALKPASPIFRLATNPADVTNDQFTAAGAGGANGEASGVTAEHTDTGVYVVSGSLGFATDGVWPIPWVIPQDGNGNNLVFVETEQADDGTITVKTYSRKFDVSTASVVADQPMDIPDGRWVDLRLKMPEPDESEAE